MENKKTLLVVGISLLGGITVSTLVLLLVACQPQTVIVENRGDGVYVPITPQPGRIYQPVQIMDRNQSVHIGSRELEVYTLLDWEEKQRCTLLYENYGYQGYLAMSCRPMTVEELEGLP